jgi:anti-sigma factor ChrR (cupin superfamily)
MATILTPTNDRVRAMIDRHAANVEVIGITPVLRSDADSITDDGRSINRDLPENEQISATDTVATILQTVADNHRGTTPVWMNVRTDDMIVLSTAIGEPNGYPNYMWPTGRTTIAVTITRDELHDEWVINYPSTRMTTDEFAQFTRLIGVANVIIGEVI